MCSLVLAHSAPPPPDDSDFVESQNLFKNADQMKFRRFWEFENKLTAEDPLKQTSEKSSLGMFTLKIGKLIAFIFIFEEGVWE